METKGKGGFVVEYVIRDKNGNIKEQGIERGESRERGGGEKDGDTR